jgi:hypothetical protein
VLHLPQEGTHRYRLLRHKEHRERRNEEIPAGKVRHESATRGKVQGEVIISSHAATQDETKTRRRTKPVTANDIGAGL